MEEGWEQILSDGLRQEVVTHILSEENEVAAKVAQYHIDNLRQVFQTWWELMNRRSFAPLSSRTALKKYILHTHADIFRRALMGRSGYSKQRITNLKSFFDFLDLAWHAETNKIVAVTPQPITALPSLSKGTQLAILQQQLAKTRPSPPPPMKPAFLSSKMTSSSPSSSFNAKAAATAAVAGATAHDDDDDADSLSSIPAPPILLGPPKASSHRGTQQAKLVSPSPVTSKVGLTPGEVALRMDTRKYGPIPGEAWARRSRKRPSSAMASDDLDGQQQQIARSNPKGPAKPPSRDYLKHLIKPAGPTRDLWHAIIGDNLAIDMEEYMWTTGRINKAHTVMKLKQTLPQILVILADEEGIDWKKAGRFDSKKVLTDYLRERRASLIRLYKQRGGKDRVSIDKPTKKRRTSINHLLAFAGLPHVKEEFQDFAPFNPHQAKSLKKRTQKKSSAKVVSPEMAHRGGGRSTGAAQARYEEDEDEDEDEDYYDDESRHGDAGGRQSFVLLGSLKQATEGSNKPFSSAASTASSSSSTTAAAAPFKFVGGREIEAAEALFGLLPSSCSSSMASTDL